MAWMPVAEAAATLGVSERTIWRRIKSETIPSRSEQGRTLVSLENRDPAGDPVWQLSNVAAAQLSMRKLDADTVSDVLTIAADYRKSFDLEIARVRRTSRWAGLAVVVLLAVLFAGGWRYLDMSQKTRLEHQTALADLRDEFQTAAADLKTRSAQAIGLADVRKEEIESLRQQEAQSQSHLIEVEAARSALQTTLDQRLGALQKSLSAEQDAVKQRDLQIVRLSETLQELQTQLADKDRAREAVLRQAERVTAAIRRSAARSAGIAAGLRLYFDGQQREIRTLRRHLADARGDSEQHTQPAPPPATGTITRKALWNAIIHPDDSAANAPLPTWRDTLLTWCKRWIGLDPSMATTAAPKGLASADRSE